jgi:hypothetical protein
VVVSATLQGTTRTATATVRKETSTVTITKAEYTVNKSNLNVEATSSDGMQRNRPREAAFLRPPW